MKFINKKQTILAILGICLVLFLIGMPSLIKVHAAASSTTQNAGVLTNWFGAKAIGGVFYITNFIIGSIGGVLFQLAGGLVNFALSLNFDILNNPMIDVGWGIVRDLANLGFVLFIIIIAIATILRFQEYGAKNTLGKLIAVALLVNFSLFFAGAFIEFSNTMTNYFIQGINSNGNLGTALAGAFKIQNLLKVKDAAEMGTLMQGFMDNLGSPMLIGIASIFFVAAFTFLGALSLLALAIMFIIRLIALSILLILVPMACLSAILPATKNIWDKWIKEFLKWIIFAPAASFFLYLAVYMVINYGKVMDGLAKSAQGIGTTNQMNFASLIINDPLKQIGNMVIVIGLLFGGLIAANSMGIAGSKALKGAAASGTKGFMGWMGRKGVKTAGWAAHPSDRMLDWATNPKAGKTKQFVGKTMYKIQSGLSKVPVVKNIGAAYRGKGKDKSFKDSVWGGMKAGSGLFKKKKQQFKVLTDKGEMKIEGEPVAEEKKEEKKTS